MTRFERTAALLTFAIAMVAAQRVVAQPPQTVTPPSLVITSMYGRDLYEFYCASCHGRDLKGTGPVAPALKAEPPDLTRLAIHNGGVFPRVRVEEIVTGRNRRPLPAHGSSEMPVWGPIFRGLDPHDAANQVRISNIIDYIESLQVRHATLSQSHRGGPAARHTTE
jgi:mono/diheme cytochrome c family protein